MCALIRGPIRSAGSMTSLIGVAALEPRGRVRGANTVYRRSERLIVLSGPVGRASQQGGA
jgi:hypothetical protein